MNKTPSVQTPSQYKATIWFAIGLGLLLLVAANGHLVYVATNSQPGCVDHLRQGDPGGDRNQFRAAKSACSPR